MSSSSGKEKAELIKDGGTGVGTGHQATPVFCSLFSP